MPYRQLARQFLPPGLLLAVLMQLASLPAHSQTGHCMLTAPRDPDSPAVALASELEILSWNIQKASNGGWARDLATVGDGIDLAFIQEAPAEAGIDRALPGLHRVFAAGYATPQQQTGVMTLSNGLPSSHCEFTALEPWLRTPKATSVAALPLRDRQDRLLAINLHAVNFDLGLDSLQNQLHALRDVLDRHEGPVIVAGDLNTWSGSRQALVDRFMRDYQLNSVAFEPDLRTTVFGRALDHIYVRGLRATSARVIPVSSSDHNPLRVRLALM